LPKKYTDNGCEPNGYKLMKKFSYDFKKLTLASLRHVIDAKPYGINETQKKI